MLTTGLVSLNVHEPLTFDGTELCLHPDLFTTTTTAAAITPSTATLAAAPTSSEPLPSALSASFVPKLLSIQPSQSSDGADSASTTTVIVIPPATAGGATTTTTNRSKAAGGGGTIPARRPCLAVGDLIEIRVWDPLPQQHQPQPQPLVAALPFGSDGGAPTSGGGGEGFLSSLQSSSNTENTRIIVPDADNDSDPNRHPTTSTTTPLDRNQPPAGDSNEPVPSATSTVISSFSSHTNRMATAAPGNTNDVDTTAVLLGQTATATSTTMVPPSPGTTTTTVKSSSTTTTRDGPITTMKVLEEKEEDASAGGRNGGGGTTIGVTAAAAGDEESRSATGGGGGGGGKSVTTTSTSATAGVGGGGGKFIAATSVADSVADAEESMGTKSKPDHDHDSPKPPPLPTKTALAVATTTTGTELPPMFPRQRTSTVDAGTGPSQPPSSSLSQPQSSSTLPPKPPTISQRASSANSSGSMLHANKGGVGGGPLQLAANASLTHPATTTSVPSAAVVARSSTAGVSFLRHARHVRDISDMTIDTTTTATTNLSHTGAAPLLTTTMGTELPIRALQQQRHPLKAVYPTKMHPNASEEDENDPDEHDDDDDDDDDDDGWSTALLQTHSLRLSFVMLVTEKTLTSLKGSARTQVSLLRPIADLYNLSSYDMCTVHKIDRKDEAEALHNVSADFLLVTIKEQFISRGEMLFFQNSLLGSWVYQGQRLFEPSRGIQAHVREILHGDNLARSGIITDQTKITFRSRSARLIWLVQMSSEMWDYASPYERDSDHDGLCEVYFDRWISFIYRLFAEWKELETTHSLTVVFFSRTFVGTGPSLLHTPQGWSGERDVYGRAYEDHFKIVLENETRGDFENLVVRIKEAFVRYPSDVGWNLSKGTEARRPSSASQGNVLEAINVALNLLQYHYFDRDLNRTGNSIVVVSAGNGVNEVDKGLASITYQRMMDNGIGSDMLSLALPPLHIAPFFLYVNEYQSVEAGGVDGSGTYYEVPHWMHLSFVSYAVDSSVLHESTVEKPQAPSQKAKATHYQNVGGRLIGPNGFILPGTFDGMEESRMPSTTPAALPKTFSVYGNAAASPQKIKQRMQERQLIADRDIQDIIEACRPRNSGRLPTSLRALLKMHSIYQTAGKDDNQGIEDIFSPPLPQWGSFDTNDADDSSMLRLRSAVMLGQSPPRLDVSTSPLLGIMPSPPRVDELDKTGCVLERSSPSSCASQLSNSAQGTTYDRPFVSNAVGPMQNGMQLQRTPSLDTILAADDDDVCRAGMEQSDADSTSTTEMEIRRDVPLETEKEQTHQKLAAFRELLRRQMRNQDSNIALQTSSIQAPQSDLTKIRHQDNLLSNFGVSTSSSGWPGRSNSGGGGLGAALNQYRAGTYGNFSLKVDPDATPVTRVASATRLAGMSGSRTWQLAEVGTRGMSPLLLPPVLSSSGAAADRKPDGSQRRISMDQRFVIRSDVQGVDRQGLAESARQPSTGKQSNQSSGGARSDSPSRLSISPRRSSRSRRKRVLNPFRQEDEDEVLAQKSHNRRRWSHVFPLGEIEFKRHAGPSWKSLTIPAILPLSIDYFPPQQDVDHNYTFSIYNVTLSEFENSPYASNKELLMEMVRQRITQDYQWVPPSHVNVSTFRRESLRDGLANRGRSISIGEKEQPETIRQFLSMGHRLQVLTYDPSSDVIEVTRYDAKSAQQKSDTNNYKYHYLCFCQETQTFTKVVQKFCKYSALYNWNKVDRIICGDEDREMRDGMRFKRIMFAILPERMNTVEQEQEYTAKFVRLLEYLNKLRDNHFSPEPIDIKLVSSADKANEALNLPIESTPGISRHSMQRFYVRLKKGKRDSVEFMEVVLDSTFDTSWSFRIMFHWLVAGANKVEAQLQLLQRRCTQFGLNLVPFPQITVSKNMYLNVFKAPAIFTIETKQEAAIIDRELIDLDWIHDGVFFTDGRAIKDCLNHGNRFDFGRRWSRLPAGRQYVHRSGTLLVRLLPDLKGQLVIITIGNYLYLSRDPPKHVPEAQRAFSALSQCVHSLSKKVAADTAAAAASKEAGEDGVTKRKSPGQFRVPSPSHMKAVPGQGDLNDDPEADTAPGGDRDDLGSANGDDEDTLLNASLEADDEEG